MNQITTEGVLWLILFVLCICAYELHEIKGWLRHIGKNSDLSRQALETSNSHLEDLADRTAGAFWSKRERA